MPAATWPEQSSTGAYHAFIDTCVDVARLDAKANWIRAQGHPVRTNDDSLPLNAREAAIKSAFLALPAEHREAIALVIEDCREAAIHDLLARLEWMTACDDFKMVWRGVELPKSPYWDLHHDFISRLAGDPRFEDEGN